MAENTYIYISKSNNLAVGKRQFTGRMHLLSQRLSSRVSLFPVNVEMLQQPVSHDSVSPPAFVCSSTHHCQRGCPRDRAVPQGGEDQSEPQPDSGVWSSCGSCCCHQLVQGWTGQSQTRFLPLRGVGQGQLRVPDPAKGIHAGQQESPSLPAAGRITSQHFGVFAGPQASASGHPGFWWVLAVPETRGWSFQACAVRGSALTGRSIPCCDHRACGCCVKLPKALLEMVPSSAALAEVAQPPPRSWQSSQSHKSIWLLWGGEAQVLPHTVLHESIWKAWERQGHGDTLKYSMGRSLLEETSHHDQKDENGQFLTTVKRKLRPGTWSLIVFTHSPTTNLAISSVSFAEY